MKTSYTPRPEFTEWAYSLKAGISGGNPKGNLWFCGIEYGGDDDQKKRAETGESFEFHNGLPAWGDSFISKNRNECTTWPYVQKIAKLACLYEERPKTDYKKYILEHLCRKHGTTFLMNLYPINFPRSDNHYWTQDLFDWTGFPNKTTYHSWCMKYRFPALKDLVQKYKPRTLICNGTKVSQDFKLAFLNEIDLFKEGSKILLPMCGKYCECFSLNEGKTHLIITPFFGQGGVMSDEDLIKLSEIAKRGL